MKTICLYFEIHQIIHLKRYRCFDIGRDHYYYDDYENERGISDIAERSYIPALSALIEMAKNHGDTFKVALSISGVALEQLEVHAPGVIELLHQLNETGCCEFLCEPYSHGLSSLANEDCFREEVERMRTKIKQIFGKEPKVFRNSSLIYSNDIGATIADMGFKGMLTEGAKHILGWKSPHYLYHCAMNPNLKLLLRDFKLSDDISLRFSNSEWNEYPLFADKYIDWIAALPEEEQVINIFMELSALGIAQPLSSNILEFMKVPQDVWNAALIYTRVVFLGTLGNLGYNMNAGILRGLGDSKASLWFLVVSCVSNIVFDLLFVAGFGMDVAGAALSTSIAMFISWIVSIVYIRKKFPEIQFTFLPRRFSGTMMKDILAIGLPVGLNNSLYSLGHVALQTFNNSQGAIFMAGGAVAGRITGCSNIAITGLSSAATTFSGQNYGAKKYSRIKEGHWRVPLCSGLITLSFGLFFIMIHKPIIRFFSSDEMVLMYASRHVIVMLLSQWFYAIFNCIISIVNGTGKVRYTTIVNILMLWAVRIPSAYIINRYFDGTWVMLCFPISFSFGMFAMIGYYLFSPAWKEGMQLAEHGKASD